MLVEILINIYLQCIGDRAREKKKYGQTLTPKNEIDRYKQIEM